MPTNTEPYTIEMLMQAIKKSREEAEKRNAEFDMRLEKSYEKFEKQIEKSREKFEKDIAEIKAIQRESAKLIGGITRSNGSVAEETIYNALEKDMTFGNVKFYDIDRNRKRKNKALNLEGEFDIILENGDSIAIIEAKHKAKLEDILELVDKKLPNFRELFPKYSGYKIMLGIAGLSFEDNVENEARKRGIGVIKVTGNKAEYYTEGIKIFS